MEKDPIKDEEIILTKAQIAHVREVGKLTFKPLRSRKNLYRCNQLFKLGTLTRRDIKRIRSQVSWPSRG